MRSRRHVNAKFNKASFQKVSVNILMPSVLVKIRGQAEGNCIEQPNIPHHLAREFNVDN